MYRYFTRTRKIFFVLLALGTTLGCLDGLARKEFDVRLEWTHWWPGNIDSYTVHCGRKSGKYTFHLDLGYPLVDITNHPDYPDIPLGLFDIMVSVPRICDCFALTATNRYGESPYSEEQCLKIQPVKNVRIAKR